MKKHIVSACLVSLVAGVAGADAWARDYISIVGSSTVYPFSTAVAEQFGKTTKFKTPKVESTGSGGGLKLFCSGVGTETPDIANSSRRIKQAEFDQCKANGVTEIIEVKIGYDGIVLASSKKAARMNLSRRDIFLPWPGMCPIRGVKARPWPIPPRPGRRSTPNCRRRKSRCWDRRPLPAPGMPLSNWPWKEGARKSPGSGN